MRCDSGGVVTARKTEVRRAAAQTLPLASPTETKSRHRPLHKLSVMCVLGCRECPSCLMGVSFWHLSFGSRLGVKSPAAMESSTAMPFAYPLPLAYIEPAESSSNVEQDQTLITLPQLIPQRPNTTWRQNQPLFPPSRSRRTQNMCRNQPSIGRRLSQENPLTQSMVPSLITNALKRTWYKLHPISCGAAPAMSCASRFQSSSASSSSSCSATVSWLKSS